MNTERRAGERGVGAMTVTTIRITSRSFWHWFESHHIDSLGVIVITLWLTVRVVEWMLAFPYDIDSKLTGAEKAMILGAVLTPWGLTQGLMFKFYIDLKRGGNGSAYAPAPVIAVSPAIPPTT